MTAADPTHRAVEAVWRIESARLVATLARLVRDVGLAEELAQDALVIALEQWPVSGVPDEPGPWLIATAKHRAIDLLRRQNTYAAKLRLLTRDAEANADPPAEPETINDDLLRLMFTAAHPVLSTEAKTALTLRLFGGLTTVEIARAFLITESTAGQRISRAKRTLAEAGVQFDLPGPEELAQRLGDVLGVVYLIFNEGYSATGGTDWTRPDLCHEALRLGRVLAGLLPREAEVHGLVALMEMQASRLPARTDRDGDPVLLPDQDRRLWDRLLIRRGQAALDRATGLGGGPYTLQAEIAAELLRPQTDWARIAALYEVLAYIAPTPVVLLNRAIATGMAGDARRALELLRPLDEPLKGYAHLAGARGEMLTRLGRTEEARAEFARAATLTGNEAERRLFLRRARSR